MSDVDYGPLAGLIGAWRGSEGTDIAPEPDATETNPYYETITYTGVGDATNAESQVLVALHYVQVVQRKSTDKVFHHQTGYWMWDAKAELVMHSFSIPRAITVLAGGKAKIESANKCSFELAATLDDKDWQISQSPFMRDNARTLGFNQVITLDGGKLHYQQTTLLDIYGKKFEHTDTNELVKD